MAVLHVLVHQPNGEAAIATIVQQLPNYLNLSAEDRVQSMTRPNEELWEQQVRNITSHKNTPGNYIHEGYLGEIPRGLKITDAGKLHLNH